MKLFVFAIAATATGSSFELEFTQKTWIWGPDIPDIVQIDSDDLTSADDYPAHGFIQLGYTQEDGEIEISLVQRPTGEHYPEDESFCSRMLPAAISDFMTEQSIQSVISLTVFIDADPYVAACKCYVRTMIRMGLSYIISSNDRNVADDQVDEFCSFQHSRLTAYSPSENEDGHSPSGVTQDHLDTLSRTASFVLTEKIPL